MMSTGTLRIALLLAVPLFGACRTGISSADGGHWTSDSIPARMTKHFTGFRADRDGRYVDYQYGKKKSISKTLRRHFVGNSPDNPFEAVDPSQTNRRPPHSLAPDPMYYMGVESIVIGTATLGITGGFVPVPIDSVIATVSEGGWDEFTRGFTEGADAEAKNPPGVSKFKVKNR